MLAKLCKIATAKLRAARKSKCASYDHLIQVAKDARNDITNQKLHLFLTNRDGTLGHKSAILQNNEAFTAEVLVIEA